MRIFLFLSYSFGIKKITIFIDSVENHTRFKTKMRKVYTRFLNQNSAKTLPDNAAHGYMACISEYSPFSASEEFLFCNKTINANNKTRKSNKARFL